MALQQKQVEKQMSLCKGNVYNLASLAIESKIKSAALIKDLTGIIVSSILYYRKIIPSEMFVDKKLGNQRVKILKTNNKHNLADNFCEMMFSVYESIELEYLKKMVIIFVENDQPVEIHKLFFEHTGESYKGIMVEQTYSKSKIHLKHQVNKLKEEIFHIISCFIQTLINIKYIINKPSVAIELYYFNDKTPKEYTAKYFEQFDGTKEKHRLATQPIRFGKILTPFHGLELKSQFKPGVNEEAIRYLEKSTNDKTEDTNDSDKNNNNKDGFTNCGENGSFTEVEQKLVGEALDNDSKIFIKEEESQIMESPQNYDDLIESDQTENFKQQKGAIRCPCKINIDDCLLVKCSNCKMFQHIYCFDMLTDEHIPNTHICDECAILNPHLKCTVPELSTIDANEKTHRCIFRLILGLSYHTRNKLSKEYLVNKLQLRATYADDLLNLFDQLQIIHRSGTINTRLFERETIPNFFQDHSMMNKQSAVSKRPRQR